MSVIMTYLTMNMWKWEFSSYGNEKWYFDYKGNNGLGMLIRDDQNCNFIPI